MLEYVYRFTLKSGKVGDFLEWLEENEGTFDEHGPAGWHYLGAWFVVRGFGGYDCEMRYQLDDYGALGSGFGDEENLRMLREFFSEYLDHNHRPEAVLLKTRDVLAVAEGY